MLLLTGLLAVFPAGEFGRIRVQAARTAGSGYMYLQGGSWVSRSGGRRFRYKKADGTYARDGWARIDGLRYYFTSKGYVQRGLKKIGGKYFLFSKHGGAGQVGRMLTGVQSVGGKLHYFREKGRAGVRGSMLKSGWQTIDGKKYYFNKDGEQNPFVVSEKKFIRTVARLARRDMRQSGILASVTIAQAILESDYGRSLLGLEANNLFGMKAVLSYNNWESDWDGSTCDKETLEYVNGRYIKITAAFRAYPSYAESIRDHSNYLRFAKHQGALRYKGVENNKSYKRTIRLIKKGGYATDPAYVAKICRIIRQYDLTKYDR